jgi:hypothetical protein
MLTDERGKCRVVEPERHTNADHRPGGKQHDGRRRCGKHEQAGHEHEVGKTQHAPPAMSIDVSPDKRPERRHDQQAK